MIVWSHIDVRLGGLPLNILLTDLWENFDDNWRYQNSYDNLGGPAVCTVGAAWEVSGSIPYKTDLGNELFQMVSVWMFWVVPRKELYAVVLMVQGLFLFKTR